MGTVKNPFGKGHLGGND